MTLRAPAAERRELRAQVPEDGIALDVDIGSIVGPVTDGAVEARVGDTLVGAAPVENGAAHLTLTFRSPEKEATVRLRYVPASPWFEPLGDTVLRVPIRGPNLLTKAPLLLAGLAVLAFFLLGRVSSRQQKPEPAPVKEPPNEGRPRMDVVRLAARGEWGWRGAVTDAHEEAPIAAVKLWIQRGTFDGRLVLAETTTDSQGMFAITTHFEIAGDEQLGSEGRFHAQLLQPLPPRGELAIALVSRRRALLQRMVRWAKGAGQPFDARPEPTPGHVRRAAAGDATTAQWADAMEHAAFDRGEIDADAEREIERLAPPLPAALTQTPPGKSAKLLETREPRAGDEGDGPSTGPGTTADRR